MPHASEPKRLGPASRSGSSVWKTLKRIARNASLTDDQGKHWVSPHVLRATGASIAVQAGVPPHIAQQQLGHSNLRTTQQHYLRLPTHDNLKQYAQVFGSG